MSLDLNDINSRMAKAIDALKHEFTGLRTGRANPALLESVRADVYGSMMPLNQIASISAPEPRMLSVSVWDKNNVSAAEKAIQNSGLGLSPNTEGNVIRVNLPELTEDRRKELAKVAAQTAENAKVAVRNIRRDGMDQIKKMQNDKAIGEDAAHDLSDKVQQSTDKYVAEIDKELDSKTADIMKV